jgi:hypothetical protein
MNSEMIHRNRARPENPHAPLTIAHGKQIYQLGTKISAQIEEVSRMLSPIQTHSPEHDPIVAIVNLLQQIASTQKKQEISLQDAHRKLDTLGTKLSANWL